MDWDNMLAALFRRQPRGAQQGEIPTLAGWILHDAIHFMQEWAGLGTRHDCPSDAFSIITFGSLTLSKRSMLVIIMPGRKCQR